MITKTKATIGPQHQGRKMSLKAFEFANVEEGYIFELARGYIVVSEVPRFSHACVVTAVRDPLVVYKATNPGRINQVLGTMECNVLIPGYESERHPDVAVYLRKPPGLKDRTMWRTWLPDLIIEVVSPRSVDRDYVEKREEYWSLGVKEYWIVDAAMERVLILRRGKNDWIEKELHRDDLCETKLLPGFKLACSAIFEAARDVAGDDSDDE